MQDSIHTGQERGHPTAYEDKHTGMTVPRLPSAAVPAKRKRGAMAASLCLAALLSLLCVGCQGGRVSGLQSPVGTTEKRPQIDVASIERVLIEDSRTTEAASLEGLTRRISKMEAIDTYQCPTDFRQAYLAHIAAWRQGLRLWHRAVSLGEKHQSDVARFKEKNSGVNAFIESFVRGLVFDLGKPKEIIQDARRLDEKHQAEVAQIGKEWERNNEAIASTFSTVQQIAAGYGAKLPKE